MTEWRLARAANAALTRIRSGFALRVGDSGFRVCPLGNGAAPCDDQPMPVTVVIVDDHPSFRASARALLELEGFEVVGEAADGKSGLEIAKRLRPELVLLDVALPDTNGFDVAERLFGGPSKVILTSSREQRDLGKRIRSSGALGFVPKDQLSGPALAELMEGAP